MGKHDEIWQSINELDDRVTRLEERETLQQDGTVQSRQWRVGDVVRLEDSCYLNEKFRAMVGTHHTITGGNEHYAKIGVHLWPASALTLIRAAGEPADCTDLEREVERLTAERDALRARIEAAEKKFATWVNSGLWLWSAPGFSASLIWSDVCDALNYNKPIAPIADAGEMDERKGERRTGQWSHWKDGSYGKRKHDSDRRRTPGTRADRKAEQ